MTDKATFRKDGFYQVKYKGNWKRAKWVTNQDYDSGWSCWWIEGEEPKSWGWSDGDLEEIDEYRLIGQTLISVEKENLKENSFTLDFGINNKGETFLIEVNDGWAVGNYGLPPNLYYSFIKNRWLQMTGVIK